MSGAALRLVFWLDGRGRAGKNGTIGPPSRERELMANWHAWHNRLTWTACAWFAACVGLFADEPVKWKTGPALRQQLAVAMSVTWVERELRDALAGVSEQLDIAVFLDRRIDPGQPINLSLRKPAEEVLRQLAAAGHAEWRAVGPVIYVGPAQTAAKLPTLAALRRQEAERLGGEARSRLLKAQAWQWQRLAEPRRLLDELARQAGVTVSGAEQVPHDLWPAVSLPPLAWTDRLSLLVAGFDLTFEIADQGKTVRLVPIPASVVLEKSYRPRGAAGAVAAQLRLALSDAEVRVEQGQIVVAGLQEDHEKVELLLAGQSARTTKTIKKGPEEKRYSMTAGKNDPAGAVVRTIATQLGKELKYDAAVLEKLKQNVPLSVKEVTLDELLTTVLKPLSLTYKLTDEALEIVPAE
jgi:hypothetical protein